jgi:hypothetical protein
LRLTDPGRELTRAGSPSNLMPVAGDGGGPSPGGGPPGSGQPTATSQELPLTWMARAATLGRNGADVIGYRNYLGVEVVGAWVWLPEYGMGVATEMAAQEAFQTLYVLRRAFLALFLLLVFSGAAIFAFTILVERLQSSIRLNALAARRLGQYVLVQEIGRGANGLVYLARWRSSCLARS